MRCVGTVQNNACVQEGTLNLLNVVYVLGYTDTPVGHLAELAGTNIVTNQHCVSASTNVSAHQQTHNRPVAASKPETQDVFTLLSMPIKQLGMSLLIPEKSGLNSAWASMRD